MGAGVTATDELERWQRRRRVSKHFFQSVLAFLLLLWLMCKGDVMDELLK